MRIDVQCRAPLRVSQYFADNGDRCARFNQPSCERVTQPMQSDFFWWIGRTSDLVLMDISVVHFHEQKHKGYRATWSQAILWIELAGFCKLARIVLESLTWGFVASFPFWFRQSQCRLRQLLDAFLLQLSFRSEKRRFHNWAHQFFQTHACG